MNKKALITGVTGQDGAYLSEFLLKKDMKFMALREERLFNTDRIDHLYQDPHEPNSMFFLHFGDMTDTSNLIRLIQEIQPDEIYNLAAMSHVRVSFDVPEYVADADGLGTLRLLEAIRILGLENIKQGYIKLQLLNCMVRFKKYRKQKQPFILDHPMLLPKCMLIDNSKLSRSVWDFCL